MDSKLFTIRSKKIGICIKDARLKAQKSVEEAASFLGIRVDKYVGMENGTNTPSFPQLESLAHLYQVPFDSLTSWHPVDETNPTIDAEIMSKVVKLREHVVAAFIAKTRLEKQLSVDHLAEQIGVNAGDLSAFEKAEKPIPYPILLELAEELDLDLPSLHSPHLVKPHAVVEKQAETPAPSFADLPADLVEFINQPINLPYLELAKKLSSMNVDKLRDVAESLLEITY